MLGSLTSKEVKAIPTGGDCPKWQWNFETSALVLGDSCLTVSEAWLLNCLLGALWYQRRQGGFAKTLSETLLCIFLHKQYIHIRIHTHAQHVQIYAYTYVCNNSVYIHVEIVNVYTSCFTVGTDFCFVEWGRNGTSDSSPASS